MFSVMCRCVEGCSDVYGMCRCVGDVQMCRVMCRCVEGCAYV